MIKETKEILDDGSILYEDDNEEGNYYRIYKLELCRYYRMIPVLFEQIKKFHVCMNSITAAVWVMGEISNNIEQITGPEPTQIAREYTTVHDTLFDVCSDMETRLNRLAKSIIK